VNGQGGKRENGSAPGPGGASTFTHQTLLVIMKEQYQGMDWHKIAQSASDVLSIFDVLTCRISE